MTKTRYKKKKPIWSFPKTQLHQRKRSKKSLSNEWWTPDKLFDFLCKYYKKHPILDVTATFKNSKCIWYLDKKADATDPDTKWVILNGKRVMIWCNPPNENLQELLFSAYYQWVDSNCKQEIMMIVPANVVSSQGFWINVRIPEDFGENVSHREIEGRPEFLDNGKKPDSSARNAYIVICWGFQDPHSIKLISQKRELMLTHSNKGR